MSEVLRAVINDILKLRNWRKLTMSNCVSQRELITIIFFYLYNFSII